VLYGLQGIGIRAGKHDSGKYDDEYAAIEQNVFPNQSKQVNVTQCAYQLGRFYQYRLEQGCCLV
jgi:hypothetical protein